MRANPKRIILIFMLIAFVLVTMLATYVIQRNQSPTDAQALFGGRIESGYPSAGFLLIETTAGGLKLCGYSVLSGRVAITASHCVDDAKNIYMGRGDFNQDTSNLLKVDKAVQKAGWVESKARSSDFAVLNFSDTKGFFSSFAEVASVVEGCKYRVVAYGRTENAGDSSQPPRKSTSLCATSITQDTFLVQGNNAGICFGDSGSPVFFDGTNRVVGVITSILKQPGSSDTASPCDFNNTAVVVRADANKSMIEDSLTAVNQNTQELTVVDGTTVEVVSDTLLSRIGLSRLENLTEDDKFRVAIIGIIILMIIIIAMLIKLLRTPEKRAYVEI
ncbi:MAG: trypsin-like serine protease [Candidatus Dojkabacteria bacterium]